MIWWRELDAFVSEWGPVAVSYDTGNETSWTFKGQKFRTERQLDSEEEIYSLELYVVTDDPG